MKKISAMEENSDNTDGKAAERKTAAASFYYLCNIRTGLKRARFFFYLQRKRNCFLVQVCQNGEERTQVVSPIFFMRA